jgi:hypothetical protein
MATRQPQGSSLKPFSFFTSHARQPDGTDRLYLQMGYFDTLSDAKQWEHRMRGKYPQAVAMPAPAAVLHQTSSRIPTLRAAPSAAREPGLTDSQVMQVLETRSVARGAPVSFALQLRWSVEPIDLSGVPALDIFRAYTLYATEGHREGRSWFSLRLGFFSEALSAKQVAQYVRSSFEYAAIVPVAEEERLHAKESALGRSAF